MMIGKTGIWSAEEAARSGYPFNPKLLDKLPAILNHDKWVIDLGCGNGYYLKGLSEAGFAVVGYDGFIPEGVQYDLMFKADLAKPMPVRYKGQVLSFEVGEHIPVQYEGQFITNLVSHCNSRLVLSWAIEGQGGIGHVNCRNNDYIIDKITARGFNFNKHMSAFLRADTPMDVRYFENTLMVFDKI